MNGVADNGLTDARLADVLRRGWLDGELDVQPLGEGHINETLLVADPTGNRFVLQRINRHVFADPELVMENLTRIRRLVAQRAPGLIPDLLPTRDGRWAVVDEADDWWRLWCFVEHSRSFGTTADPAIAQAAGAAFGRFQSLLAGLGAPALQPTIPGFLDLAGYLRQFDDAWTASGDAALEAQKRFVDAHRWLADRFRPADCYIHGDCKLNNLLFAEDGPRVVAVLDLDTVMQGHWAWDFGDLARSVFMSVLPNPRADELGRLFVALVRGFSGAVGFQPQATELAQAPLHVAVMLGVRFLTDHLQGDRYFKVSRRGDNLRRAREQFALVEQLRSRQELLTVAAQRGLG